jgi:hypothetical protein
VESYSVSKDNISVQNVHLVRIFQCKVFSQYGDFSTKYVVRKDMSVQYLVSKNILVVNIHPVRIFQSQIFIQ